MTRAPVHASQAHLTAPERETRARQAGKRTRHPQANLVNSLELASALAFDFGSTPLRAPPPSSHPEQRAVSRNAAGDPGSTTGAIVGGLLGAAGGAALGFALGGPIGALVGGLLGGGLGALIGSQVGGGGAAPQAGNLRSVDVQPVIFRDNAADPRPTGGSWSRRLGSSNTVWGKLGVSFNDSSPVTIDDPALKTAGGSQADFLKVLAAHSDASKVCVFLTDNDIAPFGGGGTIGGGAAGAKIGLSDRGTSDTLLAHELGHVLGLGHPPDKADDNTIMTPSGSNNSDNPTRNTMGNYRRITWPAAGAATTIHPDS